MEKENDLAKVCERLLSYHICSIFNTSQSSSPGMLNPLILYCPDSYKNL